MKNTLLILIFLFTSTLAAEATKRKVLFLGNSYTDFNNLPAMVSAAATSAGDTLVYDMFAPGGYTLDQHFQNTLVVNKIKAGDWDFVVLQEQSQKPAFPQYSFSASVVLSNMIRQYNPCARPLFYRTWGRKNGDTPNCSFWPPLCTYLGMDSMLHLRYLAMAQINHAEVSPVGQVWKAIRQQFPSIELYNADESHPSVAGSYAAACSFYTSIFKKNPLSITYNSSIPIANAISIRQMAKLVVFDSLSKWHFPDQAPLAQFTYFAGTQPNSIRFFNHSERAAGYFWSFGDGDTSTQESPVHTFPANGPYTVTLTVTRCDLDTVYEHKIQKVIQFCDFTPNISPDTIMLCSVNPDTLQTQNFESYQWFNDDGDSIPGANSRFYIPVSSGWHHVQATQNGCTEVSQPAFVNAMTSFNFYYVEKDGVADSLCNGDTLLLVLKPVTSPLPADQDVQWFVDGNPIQSSANDSLRVTATGSYHVVVYDPLYCPGSPAFTTEALPIQFEDCTVRVPAKSKAADLLVYPNPGTNFTVRIPESMAKLPFWVTDAVGKIIASGWFDGQFNTLKMDQFKSGLYYLRVGDRLVERLLRE